MRAEESGRVTEGENMMPDTGLLNKRIVPALTR